MSYIHDFMPFFVPAEGLLQGWHLSDSQNQKTCCFYTAKKLHREDFIYTQKPLHREGFTQSSFYTDTLAHRRFYIQKLLHRKPFPKEALPHEAFTQSSFTHRCFFTKKFLHTGILTGRCPSFYTHELLHTHALQKEAFRHRNFYSLFTRKLLHRSFCTEMPLQTKAFTRRSFTQRSL